MERASWGSIGGFSGRVKAPTILAPSDACGAATIRRWPPDHATAAEEEYLQTLFWLFEAGLPMTGANLARAMQLSAPTVHEMLGRLERDGYIARDTERAIELHRRRARARRARSSAATG